MLCDPLAHLRSELRLHAGLTGETMDERARAMDLALAASARLEPGFHVLDLGCGRGHLAQLVSRSFQGVSVKAVDRDLEIDPPMVADARALPFAAQSFDAVLAQESFAWIDGLHGALAETARVLKPGGRLAIGDFAFTRPEDADAWTAPISRLPENGWRSALSRHGFVIESETHHEAAVIGAWRAIHSALRYDDETLGARRQNLAARIATMKAGRARRFIIIARKT